MTSVPFQSRLVFCCVYSSPHRGQCSPLVQQHTPLEGEKEKEEGEEKTGRSRRRKEEGEEKTGRSRRRKEEGGRKGEKIRGRERKEKEKERDRVSVKRAKSREVVDVKRGVIVLKKLRNEKQQPKISKRL